MTGPTSRLKRRGITHTTKKDHMNNTRRDRNKEGKNGKRTDGKTTSVYSLLCDAMIIFFCKVGSILCGIIVFTLHTVEGGFCF